MQASLLASAALTAEVDTLKQNLERSEQLKYVNGAIAKSDRINAAIVGATTEVATLKQALSEAKKRAAMERTDGRSMRHRLASCGKSSRLS